jgi:hypothetical protein
LVKLSELIDWEHFEVQWGATFCENGRPGIATRLIAGLHYLKHTYALSDEQVVQRWSENPYWHYFCGETYFQHELPLNPRWNALPKARRTSATSSVSRSVLRQLTGIRPERCYVDLGYRGHDVIDVEVYKARQKRGVTKNIRRELKRRNAIEPIIGHMKNDFFRAD